MDSLQRKKKTMDTAMKLIANRGLDNFSVAQTACAAGINEALIYRDFQTKENLLYCCYISVNQEIVQLYTGIGYIPSSRDEIIAKMKNHWYTYFNCLINEKDKTLFCQQYRDSSFFPMARKRIKEQNGVDIEEIVKRVAGYYIKADVDMDIVCSYVIDGSYVFAKKFILSEQKDPDAAKDAIWSLFYGGIMSLAGQSKKDKVGTL